MKGRMPALFVKSEMPPCKKDGIECQRRYVGCHADCQEFIKWRSERNEKTRAAHHKEPADYVREGSYEQWMEIETKRHRRRQKK